MKTYSISAELDETAGYFLVTVHLDDQIIMQRKFASKHDAEDFVSDSIAIERIEAVSKVNYYD